MIDIANPVVFVVVGILVYLAGMLTGYAVGINRKASEEYQEAKRDFDRQKEVVKKRQRRVLREMGYKEEEM